LFRGQPGSLPAASQAKNLGGPCQTLTTSRGAAELVATGDNSPESTGQGDTSK
jgi:hypothetical protein